MQFTFRNPARSTDPDRTLPGAASLIVGAYDYQRTAPPMPADVPVARVAAYSWEDHYAVLRAALERGAASETNLGALIRGGVGGADANALAALAEAPILSSAGTACIHGSLH